MKDKIIPIIFEQYLHGMSSGDFEDYETNSTLKKKQSILNELSKENACQLLEGTCGRIHESSHRDVFYYYEIHCTFLHIAIQLNDIQTARKLLNEYHVYPETAFEYTCTKEETSYDSNNEEKERTEERISISIHQLAQHNMAMLDLLNVAIEKKNQKFVSTDEAVLSNVHVVEEEETSNEQGYETDTEVAEIKKEKKYKSRLILGDGNLSYSRALLAKQQNKGHKDFSKALTVTEYCQEEELQGKYTLPHNTNAYRNFQANINTLREMGAEVILGVDATNIHSELHDRRFKRIHFNFPYYYDDKLTPQQKKDKTRELVGQFFKSASKVQKPGDRIYMALVTGFNDPVWYENATYGIAEFCESEGYAYITKRNFIDPAKGVRYPGYFHVKTSSNAAVATAETGREFVFEKKILGKEYGNSSQKKKTLRGVPNIVLKDRDTDSDSSSYVEQSSDDEAKPSYTGSSLNPPASAIKIKKSFAAILTLGGTISTSSSAQKEKDANEAEKTKSMIVEHSGSSSKNSI